jgi:hypothetical protein
LESGASFENPAMMVAGLEPYFRSAADVALKSHFPPNVAASQGDTVV